MKVKLKDITKQIFDGKHGGCSVEKESSYYFMSVKDINGLVLDYKNAMQIPKKEFDEIFERTNLEDGDILYANTGDTIGKCVFNKNNKLNKYTAFQKSIAVIKPNAEIVYPVYLYFKMKYETPKLRAQANGSGQKNLLLDTMRNYEMEIHNYSEQIKIASILEKIEQKIIINGSIIYELESMAKTLYDYWFLQFEFPNEEGKPYKSSGGKMVYNEELQREIPEGWEVKTIGDLVMRNNKKFDYKSVQKNIDLSVMPSDSIAVNQFNSSKDFSTNLFVMNKGDILFGSIRPYLHKACIAPCMGTFAGTVYSYAVKEGKDYNLVLTTLTRKAFFDYAESCCQGTKMPVVRNESILEYKLAYNSKFAKLFNDYVNIKDSVPNLIMQNQELASLRDFLLPMLMNGQVTFK